MIPYLNGTWLLVLVLVAAIYKYFTKNNNYWKDRNVPFPAPEFFFGNFHDLLANKKCSGELYRDIYNQFPDSRFVGVFKFQQPILMLRDPDDMKQVMITDFNSFQDRFTFINTDNDPLSNHLFNSRGKDWKPTRQALSPCFTATKLKNMFNLIVEIADEFSRYANKFVENGDEVKVRDMTARYTTDVIGTCGFGLKMDSMENDDAEFRKHGKNIMKPSLKKFIGSFLKTYNITLLKLFKISNHDKNATNFLLNLVKDITNQRQKPGSEKRNDFIDLLLELKAKEESGNSKLVIDNIFMASQAYVFIAAGFETSSTLMAFTLYLLAKHPDVQSKVADEIQRVLSNHNNKITYESMNELPYLDMVISECQRFYPALTTISRVCTSPHYTFSGSNIRVERGTNVVIPVYAMHFDSKYFPEPEKFIPERFSDEANKDRRHMTFLPYGEGPRNCIGLRLGKLQSKVGLVALLKDYTVEPSPKTPVRLRLNPKSFVSAPRDEIYLKFNKRKKI